MTTHVQIPHKPALAFDANWLLKWRPVAVEHWIFATCMAIAMVHFVDATTIHWQRDAAPIERLAQFLLAVSIPVAATLAYGRMRCGWRALLLLGFGFAAVTSGFVIHVVGAIKNGAGSGDYTGFAWLAAGAVLVVMALPLGLAWLPGWRWRVVALPVVAVVVLNVLVPAGIAVYASHAPRYEITDVDLGRPYDDVQFETSDGLTVRGWYAPSMNGAAVMVLHGSGGARIRPVEHARMLVDEGYGVLLIDLRGHGESDGATNAFGWGAWPDVEAAAAFLNGRPDVEGGRVGVLGISMGAEVGLEAVTHIDTVQAVVADGAGVRSINELNTLPTTRSRMLEYPSYAVSNAVTSLLSGESIPPEMASRVELIDTPTLLISSKVAEERDINRIWHERMAGVAELWELADTAHTGGLRTHPEEYERRVVGFLNDHLLTD